VRRAPKETTQDVSTNVFSSEAWSNSNTSYATFEVEETIDLSQYAATSLPDTFTTSSRSPRYTPSPHSPQYEPSPNQSNSESNPFDHSAYDGRPAAPLPQNAKYEDMPSSLRKRKLGAPIEGLVPEQNHIIAPQTPLAPQAYIPAPNKTVEIDHEQAYKPAPQTSNPHLTTTATPPAQHSQPTYQEMPPSAPPVTSIPVNDETIESEVPLSDFEKDFIEEKFIDLTEEIVEAKVQPVPPSIFNTGQVPAYEPIAYNTNDSVFGTQHQEISDSDRLYKDPNPSRDTIQIDLDLLKRLGSKISIKVVAIALVAILLFTAAYLVMKPASNSNQNTPASSSDSSLISSEKTVVPSADQGLVAPEPSVTLPPVDPNSTPQDGGGAIVTYDENGNAVYSSPTNQNFNGD